MNDPQVVCIGCGSPTGWYKPFCDDCARFYVHECGVMPFCVLCHAGFAVEHGLHKTKTGGYAGPCALTSTQHEAKADK